MEDWKMALQVFDHLLDQHMSPLISQLQANSLQLRSLSTQLAKRHFQAKTAPKSTGKLGALQRKCTTTLTTPRTSAAGKLHTPRASVGKTLTGPLNPFPRPAKPTPIVIRGTRPLSSRLKSDLQSIPSPSGFKGDMSRVSPISHSSSSSLTDVQSLVSQLT